MFLFLQPDSTKYFMERLSVIKNEVNDSTIYYKGIEQNFIPHHARPCHAIPLHTTSRASRTYFPHSGMGLEKNKIAQYMLSILTSLQNQWSCTRKSPGNLAAMISLSYHCHIKLNKTPKPDKNYSTLYRKLECSNCWPRLSLTDISIKALLR